LTGLRRCLFYKPLAILMSILLLPAVPSMEGGGAGLLAFQTFKIEGLPLGAIKPWLRSLD